MSGKGDRQRPTDKKLYDLNFELIFENPSKERKEEILKLIDELKK